MDLHHIPNYVHHPIIKVEWDALVSSVCWFHILRNYSNSNFYFILRQESGKLSTLAGMGCFADGVGSFAKFSAPIGIAVDSADNVYVADQDNHKIRKINSAGACFYLVYMSI